VSDDYFAKMLAKLVRDGWLKRIRRGLYLLGPSLHFSPIHEFEIAMHLFILQLLVIIQPSLIMG